MKREYPIYKGLQRPLVFKVFRGRYIYWGAGAIIGGVVGGMLAGAVIGPLAGIFTLCLVSLPLLHFTLQQQKKGLYDKRVNEGIFILTSKQHLRHGKKSV